MLITINISFDKMAELFSKEIEVLVISILKIFYGWLFGVLVKLGIGNKMQREKYFV